MSFVWSSSGIGQNIKSLHTSEIQTNVIHEYDHLSLSAWAWSEIPASAGTYVQVVDDTEIMTAMDHAYDNNHCNSQYFVHDATIHSGHYSADDASKDSSHLTTVLSTVDIGQNAGACGGNDSGYCYAEASSLYSNQCKAVCRPNT